MALDQSALLEVLDALKAADVVGDQLIPWGCDQVIP